jgi:hypothetical protein
MTSPLSAEGAATYIFRSLATRHGPQWVGSRRQGAPAISLEERLHVAPIALLKSYQLLGVCGDAHAGLLGWLEGRYPLIARPDIPTPTEMLEIQCEGKRFVTLMLHPEDQLRTFGRHAGALEFLLHDLEHAHKYFGEAQLAAGQKRFFHLLRESSSAWGLFDSQFQEELDYLRSDMNSHPIHMLKYLKAIWLNAFKRAGRSAEYDEFCARQFTAWGLPFSEAMSLNSPGQEHPQDHHRIANFYLRL